MTAMINAMLATAREYRRAMRRHEFSEPQWRIVDAILFYSYEREKYEAVIPIAQMLGMLCGLTKSKVSAELRWLTLQKVVEARAYDIGKGRQWWVFSLLPPDCWRVPLRLEESAERQEMEAWLESVDMEQPDLVAPPVSLNDALRETFVDGVAAAGGRRGVESSRVEEPARGERPGCGVEDIELDRVESRSGRVEKVTSQVTFVEKAGEKVTREVTIPQKVTCQVTLHAKNGPKVAPSVAERAFASIDSNRLIESKEIFNSIDIDVDRGAGGAGVMPGPQTVAVAADPGVAAPVVRLRGSAGDREEAARRLWACIGQHEQYGRSSAAWRRAIETMPNRLQELVGTVEMLKREGRVRNPAAWLNASVRTELAMVAAKEA